MAEILTAHPVIDGVLAHHEDQLGADLTTYRNHVYRGLNYQLRLLGQDEPSNDLALAWAVHDLGIWTARTFDYLDPSIELARTHAPEFEAENLPLITEMVAQHHKLRPAHDPLVETFRRADLTDVLRGNLPGAPTRPDVKALTRALPYRGFHPFLLREATRNLLHHPLHPMPMLRW